MSDGLAILGLVVALLGVGLSMSGKPHTKQSGGKGRKTRRCK